MHPASPPSLKHLQHPAALKDLTVYAPPDLRNATPFRPRGQLYLPDTASYVNLAYVTHAADRTPIATVGSLCEDIPNIQVAMLVLVDIPEEYVDAEDGNLSEFLYSLFALVESSTGRVVGEDRGKAECLGASASPHCGEHCR
ncbi:hypothetical protein B0H13DRAFT_1861622 [Mycena leptocephala]|nr:hypothetical protein B0H13DRAFT_1861622 [Mycena leptocephala]